MDVVVGVGLGGWTIGRVLFVVDAVLATGNSTKFRKKDRQSKCFVITDRDNITHMKIGGT